MKAWPHGEIRRVERAYSPKFNKFGFYMLGSFIRKVPGDLEALLFENKDPVLLVTKSVDDIFKLTARFDYSNIPSIYRDARGQYPLPNPNYQNGPWTEDVGCALGFPLRPWIRIPAPCTMDDYHEYVHAIKRLQWAERVCESPIEIDFFDAAIRRGLRPRPQYYISIDRDTWYRVDFAFIEQKIAIELDGHNYHSSKEQRTRDAKRDRNLQSIGWRILRFTGTEVFKNVDACIDDLLRFGGRP